MISKIKIIILSNWACTNQPEIMECKENLPNLNIPTSVQ